MNEKTREIMIHINEYFGTMTIHNKLYICHVISSDSV